MPKLLVLIPPDSNSSTHSSVKNSLLRIMGSAWTMDLEDVPAERSADWEHQLLAQSHQSLLWWFSRIEDVPVMQRLAQAGIPSVAFNRNFAAQGIPSIVCDLSQVVRQQFDLAWSMGKRRFALMTVDRTHSPSITQFSDCVQQLVEEHGALESYRKLVIPFLMPFRPSEEILQAVDQFMAQSPQPEALMCAEKRSFMALEVWLAAHPEIRVPEDLFVSTFDRPVQALTRLRGAPVADMDLHGMLAIALQTLERQMRGEKLDTLMIRVPAQML